MATVGDIFAIPLGDGRIAFGQIFEKKPTEGLAIIAVFEDLFSETYDLAKADLKKCTSSKPVILASSFETFVDQGAWKTVANIPPILDQSNSPAFRVAGLPLGLILESYDRKHKRLARPWEINAAPSEYSVSAKRLENVIKAYFKVSGSNWEASFDKLLFKNVVPFGRHNDKTEPKKQLASQAQGHFVFAKIMDPILPMARGKKYEIPLNEALQARGYGCVMGAGTQTQSNQAEPVAWVGLDLDLRDLEEALEFTRRKLIALGAPTGSVLEYRVGDKSMSQPIT